MEVIFPISSATVYYLFIVDSPWIRDDKPYKILLWISILLALIGIFCASVLSIGMGLFSIISPPSLLAYWEMRKIFIKKYGRNPKSTYMTFHWEKGMLKDVIFSLTYAIVYFSIMAITIYFIILIRK